MNPILSALKRVRFLSDIREMDSPPTKTSPRSNSSRPERQLRSVVFPQPEGPMTATISPRAIERSTPRRAWTRTPPAVYSFSTPLASTIALSAASSRATLSLDFPIKIRSFLRSSLFVDAQVVGATRDGDVVAVCGTVVVPTLQVQLATGGTDIPVVEPQVGSATVYTEPCGDPSRSADGDVAGATEDDHGRGARGSGEHHLQVAGATIQAERTEPEPVQSGDEPRGAAADLDVPGHARVERDLCGGTLRSVVEPVAERNPRVPDSHDTSLHAYRWHPVSEAGPVEAPQVQIGSDDDPMGAVCEPQTTACRRAERGCEMVASPSPIFRRRATGPDGVSEIHRIDVPRFAHAAASPDPNRRSLASERTCAARWRGSPACCTTVEAHREAAGLLRSARNAFFRRFSSGSRSISSRHCFKTFIPITPCTFDPPIFGPSRDLSVRTHGCTGEAG